MGDPITDPATLAVYLNDPAINVARAALFIERAQTLCESVLSPLPDAAVVIVERVAARGYVSVTGPRSQQLGDAGDPYATTAPGLGSVRLYDEDVADLRRLAGGGGAFSIDLLPAGYVAPVDCAPDDELAGWDVP